MTRLQAIPGFLSSISRAGTGKQKSKLMINRRPLSPWDKDYGKLGLRLGLIKRQQYLSGGPAWFILMTLSSWDVPSKNILTIPEVYYKS
ncbi:hypothetical protein TNCV_4015301 [Trichonephila clavipes]|nr:hypothetical protein TNCV_4015301 [Trichonephila clavipes]